MKAIYLLWFVVFPLFLQAQQTYVPDDNFEQALIDLGYDDVLDDYVLTANINTITTLDIGQKGIADITGIEGFTSLEELICDNNNITALDLSSNTLLLHIECQYNQLNTLNINYCQSLNYIDLSVNNLLELNINHCTNLKVLKCSNNSLTSLNLVNNLLLEELFCSNNIIVELDISNNNELTNLYCRNNLLNELSVENLIDLQNLFVDGNYIVDVNLNINDTLFSLGLSGNNVFNLDLTNNPLYVLYCANNFLEWIDIRNGYNDNMLNFDATNNPDLHCVFVDDIDFLYPNNWHVDDNSVFMESEAECDLAVGDVEEITSTIYPNPIENIFNVQSDTEIHELILYTVQGQVIKHFKTSENLSIGELNSGIYFLKMISNNSQRIESVIKK